MTKHISVKLPDDLIEALKSEKIIAVLATFSEKGLPHTTPIQWLYPKDSESILISINKEHQGYHNMVWQKKVMLSFLYAGNIAYSILGRAGVVRAPSMVHPLMNIVRIDVIDVKNDRSVLVNVTNGTTWAYASWEAEELSNSLMDELKELSKTL